MGPKGEADTKMNWTTDRRPYDKLNSTQLNSTQLSLLLQSSTTLPGQLSLHRGNSHNDLSLYNTQSRCWES
jgi:hypothetical protein